MSRCGLARSVCEATALSSCTGCSKERYCGIECQKLDWKVHKSMCPILKKLSNKLSSQAAILLVKEIHAVARERKDLRILEHLMLYLEHHFGSSIKETIYHEKEDGERLSDWTLDLFLHYINIGCTTIHSQSINESI
jgi:hypothetical protein